MVWSVNKMILKNEVSLWSFACDFIIINDVFILGTIIITTYS